MAVAEEITILIDSKIESAISGMKKTQDEMGKMSKKADEAGNGIAKSFNKAKGEILAIGSSVVAFYQSLKLGAESIDIASEFAEQSEAVAKRFGTDSATIISKLKVATKGTISDVNLLKMASKAMALGVTEDIDTMAKLFQYADVQGEILGKSMDEVFEGITTSIGNQNPKFLKHLGMSATALKEEAFEAGGLMSKTEILGLVMADAGPKIAKFGDASLSTADKLAQTKASAEDMKLELGKSLMPVFEEIVPLIKAVVNGFMKAPPAMKAVGFAMIALVPLAIGLYTAMGPLGLAIGGVAVVAGIFATRLAKVTEEEEALQKKSEELASTFAESSGAFDQQNRYLAKVAGDMAKLTNEEFAVLENQMRGFKGKFGAFEQYMFDVRGNFIKRKGNQLQEAYNLQMTLLEKEKVARANAEKASKAPKDKTRSESDTEKKRVEAYKQAEEMIAKIDNEGRSARLVEVEKMLANEYLIDTEMRKRLSQERLNIIEDENDRAIAEIAEFHGDVRAKEDRMLREQYEKMLRLTKAGSAERKQVEEDFAKKRKEIDDRYFQSQVDKVKNTVDMITQVGTATLDIFKQIAERTIQEVSQAREQLARLDEQNDERQRVRAEEDYQTQKANLEKEIADATKKNDLIAKAEATRSLARLNEDRNYAVQKAQLEKKAQDEEREGKKKSWAMTKAFQISEAIMNGAQVILSFAKMLGPVGAVIGTGLGLAQLALIASEPMPKFARGGKSSGGLALVGEEGPEIVDLPDGAVVHPSGVSSPYLPYMRESLGASITNRSESTVTNANRTYNITVKADDPMAMVSKIRRAFGGDAI